MIEAVGLHKHFGDVKALNGVSFKAEDGSVTGLLGPNGAGKTTALRILYTILQPDDGSASVDGFDIVADAESVKASIGVLPDSHGLYPRLTARENISYYGELHGLAADVLKSRTDELVKLLDMDDIVDRKTEGFSTGQRVKVAIARALVHQPRNVILDEPTSGLDVSSTRAMRDFISGLRAKGACVLFSSHIMQEVSALCDQIVVLAGGIVVAAGSPEDLLRETGQGNLEDAFIAAIGSEEGLE